MSVTRRQAGFTLIEVVVALSILSLVLLGTVTGMRTLGNTQVALERKTERVDEVRTVSGFLRDLMESAVVGAGSGGLTLGGGSSEASYFKFGPEFMEWKTIILFGESFGGSYIVRIASEGGQLMMRWQESARAAPTPDSWDKASSRLLVTDLEEFSISLRQRYSGQWTDEWAGDEPPALVRLQMKTAGRFWPDLILKVQR